MPARFFPPFQENGQPTNAAAAAKFQWRMYRGPRRGCSSAKTATHGGEIRAMLWRS
jgi:hypothetical protein